MVKDQNKSYQVGIEYFYIHQGPIVLQSCPVLSPFEPNQLKYSCDKENLSTF